MQTPTPEPMTYMRIYNRKKSPHFPVSTKHIEESIKMKRISQSNSKIKNKSYFFPEITKKTDQLPQKSLHKYFQKMFEAQKNYKSAIKISESIGDIQNKRNLSLSRKGSTDNLSRLNIEVNANGSYMANGLIKKNNRQESPGNQAGGLYFSNKYRLKRYEEIKNKLGKQILSSLSNFSPVHLYK
ncbi:hypothetical protein SteCoe_12595 [Stentor coeruleus]|uniref:Uncharacterized protein n=1 Tax=Stentor coeruleus TaxID=5963 RepID=A0A1R2CAD2_9CILI|nr:hypothetical protein SteCoe_12595 [Stentor coeruleus]